MGKLSVRIRVFCPHCGKTFHAKMISSTNLQFVQEISTPELPEDRKRFWSERRRRN